MLRELTGAISNVCCRNAVCKNAAPGRMLHRGEREGSLTKEVNKSSTYGEGRLSSVPSEGTWHNRH